MPQHINGIVVFATDEAAERLRRKPRTIQRWIREGKLPATKYGNEYLITEADLESFVKRVFEPAIVKALG